jgi:regulatory protein
VQRLSKSCFNKALQILARRDHSCRELNDKLRERGFGRKEIHETIDECTRSDYLNDKRFADTYLHQLQCKGNGIHCIKQKLNSKGISKEIISDSIATHCTDNNQMDACRQVLLKKIKYIKENKKIQASRPKLQRFLTGRGFSSHIVLQTLEEATAGEDS